MFAILNLCVTLLPPIKYGLNQHYGLWDVVWRISRWPQWQPSWMSEWNKFSSSESPMSPQCLWSNFSLIQLPVREQMSFQDFQDGHHCGHLGYWNRTNLAILNCHVTQMPPTKFGLNLTYHSGADMAWIFSWWPPWRPFWISERKDFSNSESLCCSDASNQVSAQSDLRFGRRCGHLGCRNRMILVILTLHVAPVTPTKFGLSLS